MACKRSTVRSRLAPPNQTRAAPNPTSTSIIMTAVIDVLSWVTVHDAKRGTYE